MQDAKDLYLLLRPIDPVSYDVARAVDDELSSPGTPPSAPQLRLRSQEVNSSEDLRSNVHGGPGVVLADVDDKVV